MAKMYGLMRLGRDAEVRRLTDGTAVANLSLAYNYGQKDDSGERPSQWVNASLWGKRAEALAEYLTKGSLHMFTLEDVHMEEYTDKEGFAAFKLSARVLDVELGPKRDSTAPAAQLTGQRRPASQPEKRQAETGTGFDDMQDDLPPF